MSKKNQTAQAMDQAWSSYHSDPTPQNLQSLKDTTKAHVDALKQGK